MAKIVSHNQEELNKELEHIKKALQACQSPPLALKQLQHKFNRKQNQDSNHNNNSTNTDNSNNNNHKNITTVVPYIQDIGEKFKKACHSRGIQAHFKGTYTLKTLLVKPKDKDINCRKVESCTTSSAPTSTAQMLTLENLGGLLETG